MNLNPEQVGVVVVMEKTVVSGLSKLAERHRWSLIHLPAAMQVMRTLGRQRIDIAVIHITVESQQSVELIEWLRATRQEVLLVAVASTHREEIERAVRHAGAHCYLPQTDEVTLERAISELIKHEADRVRQEMIDTHGQSSRRAEALGTVTRRGA
jgi:DNA-binding NarL/FixJ family response regulator